MTISDLKSKFKDNFTTIDFEEGKYIIVRDEITQSVKGYRYGEYWQDFTGNKLFNCMIDRILDQQAKIDALMLEYCPDEMTPEQIEEWGKHQKPYKENT